MHSNGEERVIDEAVGQHQVRGFHVPLRGLGDDLRQPGDDVGLVERFEAQPGEPPTSNQRVHHVPFEVERGLARRGRCREVVERLYECAFEVRVVLAARCVRCAGVQHQAERPLRAGGDAREEIEFERVRGVQHDAPHAVREVAHHVLGQPRSVGRSVQVPVLVAERDTQAVDVGCVCGAVHCGKVYPLLHEPVAARLQRIQIALVLLGKRESLADQVPCQLSRLRTDKCRFREARAALVEEDHVPGLVQGFQDDTAAHFQPFQRVPAGAALQVDDRDAAGALTSREEYGDCDLVGASGGIVVVGRYGQVAALRSPERSAGLVAERTGVFPECVFCSGNIGNRGRSCGRRGSRLRRGFWCGCCRRRRSGRRIGRWGGSRSRFRGFAGC